MKILNKIFSRKINTDSEQGSMLLELLLATAIATAVLPFVFQYQTRAIRRAENLAITREMTGIQTALERYISENREQLLKTIGRNITRVELADLENFGVSSDLIENASDKYQLRILKSKDINGSATLQGVIVMSRDDISPLRTREIVELGGNQMGFVDGTRAHGNFGAWHTNTVDLGISVDDGIIKTTDINRDNALYLTRLPSDRASDATMMSALNLGEHDIENTAFVKAASVNIDDTLSATDIVTRDLIFQNRTTINSTFHTNNATVSGVLSADSRNMDVSGTFTLADTGKFTSFNTADLWATNLTLSGLSVSNDAGGPSILKVNDAMDMTAGRIDAMFVTVGFAGSITPRLVVRNKIQDSTNPNYFWDVSSGRAQLADATLAELNRMAPMIVRKEKSNTVASSVFGAVSTNSNATVADYMNAINQIQTSVRAKYRLLNLE